MPRCPADLDWPVRTERLLIRPAQVRDAAPTFAFRTLPDVAEWMTVHVTDPVAWEAEFEVRVPNTLIIELDGTVIGDLMLKVESPWAQAEVRAQAADTQAEIGYVLDPAHSGRGYATEAVQALLAICFESLGLRRMVAQCFADNEASWRLMERVGMRREQHAVRDSLHRSGRWLDGLGYALLAEEYAAGSDRR